MLPKSSSDDEVRAMMSDDETNIDINLDIVKRRKQRKCQNPLQRKTTTRRKISQNVSTTYHRPKRITKNQKPEPVRSKPKPNSDHHSKAFGKINRRKRVAFNDPATSSLNEKTDRIQSGIENRISKPQN